MALIKELFHLYSELETSYRYRQGLKRVTFCFDLLTIKSIPDQVS